jgi:hypothetical protein
VTRATRRLTEEEKEVSRHRTMLRFPSPDFPFKTDGCSGGMSTTWRWLFRTPPPWEGCCIGHDMAYWWGGSPWLREKADLRLAACVTAKGHPVWAALMYLAVRAGGSPWLPTSWRWGYGWRYGRGYRTAGHRTS